MSLSNITYRDSSGSRIAVGAKLAEGGEAGIYSISGKASLVAKVYKAPSYERGIKLAAMLASPPADPTLAQGHRSICWPKELIYTGGDRVAGFLMNRVDFKSNRPVLTFYNPGSRRGVTPGFTWRYLVGTAMNICSVAEAIHSQGHVIGDVNESNFLVSTTSLVTLVDCDSMQVRDPKTGAQFRCPVGKGEFTPPELQDLEFAIADRDVNSDCFGLGVLFFLLLMEGFHPFAGSWRSAGDAPTVTENIRNGRFPFVSPGVLVPSPAAPPFEILPPETRNLFARCFLEGHGSPRLRPRLEEWRHTLTSLSRDLKRCSRNEHHWFGEHLSQCPWCERTMVLGGLDPFPQQASIYRPPVSQPVFMPSPVSSSFQQQPVRRQISLGLLIVAASLLIVSGLSWLILTWIMHTPVPQQSADDSKPLLIETGAPAPKERSIRPQTKVAPSPEYVAPFIVSFNEFDVAGNPIGTATAFRHAEAKDRGLIVYLPYVFTAQLRTVRVFWSSASGSGASAPSEITPGSPISIVAHLGKDLPPDQYAISVLMNDKVLQRSEIRIEADDQVESVDSRLSIETAPRTVAGDEVSAPLSKSYSATHKHVVAGCTGTLFLTKDEIRFSGAQHSFRFAKSEVQLDDDGIKDAAGKNWHFHIPNRDVRKTLREWSAGNLP